MTLTIDPKHAIGTGQLLWLVTGREPGDDDDTAQPVLADTEDEARATFEAYLHEISDTDEEGIASLIELDGSSCYIVTCEQIGQAEPDLAKRLRDLAAGARSKADLIASKSPTAAYADPVQILRALAKEAEEGLEPDPYAGLNTLEGIKTLRRQLTAMAARMDDPHGDGSGTDARAPDGDDYNRLFNRMEGGLIALIRRLDPNDPEI